MKTARQVLLGMVEKESAEQGTGMIEISPCAPLYADGGKKVSDSHARRLFRQGVTIHDPNAGAGSFRSVLSRLGFTDVEVENWTSSAGDWSFKVNGGLVFQTNRYPYHGFRYVLQREME